MADEHTPGTPPGEASVTATEAGADAPASLAPAKQDAGDQDVPTTTIQSIPVSAEELSRDEPKKSTSSSDSDANAGEASTLTATTPLDDSTAAEDTSFPDNAPPMPTISLPEEDEVASDDNSISRPKTPPSRASSVHSSHDRELPPLPEPPTSPIHMGIPLPLRLESLDTSSVRAPEPPKTPTRTSSRNAPTSSSTPNQGQRVTSASLEQSNASGQVTISSMVFVVQALEKIGASKEARRRKPLADSITRAIDAIRETAPEPPADPNVVFEPLQMACDVNNTQLATIALDCIGKLISYSYFSIIPPHLEAGMEQPQLLIERAIETICDCFQGDHTADAVQLQIVKALLAAVLNEKVVVHGAGLLKAVRQTYNIFLLSRNSANQQTAQGTLSQMVHTVFERVKVRLATKEERITKSRNGSTPSLSVNIPNGDNDSVGTGELSENLPLIGDSTVGHEKITLQSFENRKSFDDERITDSAPTTVNHRPRKDHRNSTDTASDSAESAQDDEDEVYIKDAFLVFRAMCKLSIKALPAEQIADLKSHGMRSKLLSLHLIHVILQNHMNIFVSPLSTIKSSSGGEPTGFIHAVKQYLCLSLSRNAASAAGHVFDVCCEIFWLIISNMRVMLKV